MARRPVIDRLLNIIGFGNAKSEPPQAFFPPVPSWRPSFNQSVDCIVDRMTYYTDGKRDLAFFKNGTCVILDDGLSDSAARLFSLKVLSNIFNYHPDMNPAPMDDGNVVVRYNHPAVNVVLKDISDAHWMEIEARYLDGLATSEVIITPLGQNKFDEFGKKALLGRAFMFMDAQEPEVVRIVRKN